VAIAQELSASFAVAFPEIFRETGSLLLADFMHTEAL
jgi:hypothetical protein